MKMKLKYILLAIFLVVSVTAGAVIAKNDPVDSIREEEDEQLQISAAEFIQASVVYYSVHGGLPWFPVSENGVDCFGHKSGVPSVQMPALEECIKILIYESELRPDYLTDSLTQKLVITNPNPQTGDKADTVVCFQPQSNAWKRDLHARFNKNGTESIDNRCISQGGRESCYWCTQ